MFLVQVQVTGVNFGQGKVALVPIGREVKLTKFELEVLLIY